HSRVDVLLAGDVVVRVEGELDEFGRGFNQARVLELAELPGVPEPGGNGGIGLGLELAIARAALQVGPALLDERVQPAELVEGLAVDVLALLTWLIGEGA